MKHALKGSIMCECCQEMHLRCSKFILFCQSYPPVSTVQYTEWKNVISCVLHAVD